MDGRSGDPRWAVLFFFLAIVGLVGHQVAAGRGLDEAQGGFAYGQNDNRTVIGLKLEVAPGDVVHIAMADVDPYRCGQGAAGERACAGIRPGAPGRHEADRTAMFYITEAGGAYRALQGDEPPHVLLRRPAPEAWMEEIELKRPPVPGDVQPDAEALYSSQWQPTEPEGGTLEAFWVLENGTIVRFDATDHGGGSSDAFQIRPHQVWVTAGWHGSATRALTAVTMVAGFLGGLATVAWITRLLRARPMDPSDRAERWLEAMALEMQRVDALMFRVAVVGGIMVATVVAAALFGFWAMAPPDPGQPHLLYDAAPTIGQARAAALVRWSLVVAALAAATIWTASVAQIHVRRRRMTSHLARPPEL